jgi:hypothetical protein
MPTTNFSAKVKSNGAPAYIVFTMTPTQSDFYLSQLTIDNNPGGTCASGCFSAGTQSAGGSRVVYLDSADFNALSAKCPKGATVTLILTYHTVVDGSGQTTYCIDCIECQQLPLHTELLALNRISEQLGTGMITEEIRELKNVMLRQLEAQERTLTFLQELRLPWPAPPGGGEAVLNVGHD